MRAIPVWVWILGGVALLAALTTGGVVTANYISAQWMGSSNARKWAAALSNAENTFGIPAGLLSRIAYQESRFRQDVIDGTTVSSAGALGLMQLMPQYFDTVQRPIPFSDADTSDQIVQAAQLLASNYNQLGDWTAATAAYNAGAGTINKVLNGSATLPGQTAQYIQQISADLPAVVNPTLSV